MSRRNAVLVDRESLLRRHLQGQVDREAVGVVQPERVVAGQRGPARGLRLVRPATSKICVPAAQGGEERGLLGLRNGMDRARGRSRSSGYCGPIAAMPRRDELAHRRLVARPSSRIDTDDAAHEPAQHVAAALVARGHPSPISITAVRAWSADHAQPHVVDEVGAVVGCRSARWRGR